MRSLALVLVLAALAATACDSGADKSASAGAPGGSQTTAQQTTAQQTTTPAASHHFTKQDLSHVALQPSDAPSGMRYTKAESGRKSLADIGYIVADQTRPVRKLGFEAVYDATFDSTSSDLRLASRLWLFDKPEGADRWLRKAEQDAQTYAFQPIDSPQLGDESWAAKGNVGAAVITYAFRTGNLVVVTSYTTQSQKLSEAATLAAAQRAEQRAAGVV